MPEFETNQQESQSQQTKTFFSTRGRGRGRGGSRAPSAERQQAPQQQHKPAKTLPAPTQLHDAKDAPMKTKAQAESSIFAIGTPIVERNTLQQFSVSTSGLIIDMLRETYDNMTTDPSFDKQAVPEYIDYYGTIMIWLRILDIKRKNGDPTSLIEDQIIN